MDTKQQSLACGVQFNITTDVGEMEEANCTAPFNGQTVSVPPCNREATKFFRASEQSTYVIHDMYLREISKLRNTCTLLHFINGTVANYEYSRFLSTIFAVYTVSQNFCGVQFNVTISAGEMVLGADLAMFKLQEGDSSENITYDLLILYKESEIFYSLVNPQRRQLSSTASGWEVFSIDSIATAWQPGDTSLVLFKVYVTKFNGDDSKILNCTDVASLFVLSGDSGLLQISSLEGWENYVPVLTTFSSPHRKTTQGS